MTQPTLDVILKRAHALQTLSRRGAPHEAEAAALALDRIIARYQLRKDQIEAAGEEPAAEVVLSDEPAYAYTKRQPWRSALLHVLAAHYGVVCFRRQLPREKGKKRREDTLLAGRPDDIAIVRALFAWLSVDVVRLGLSETKGQGALAAQSWRVGFVYGIKDQLARARRGNAEDSTALVRISDDRQDAALRHVEQLVKALTKGQEVGRSTLRFGMQRVDSHLAGRARGRETHLGARLQGAEDPPSGSQVS